MSILGKIRRYRELKRLKRTAARNPSPTTIGALAERYIALGRIEDAHRAARDGMLLFPTSERLSAVRTFARKQRLQAQIAKLRRDLAERPSPMVYSRLADIYRTLGNHEQALTICEQCIERFPLNENPYMVIGELRLERFLEDLISHDGLEAEKQLRRVVKLNGQNIKARMLLAQAYWVVGAVEPMLEHLRVVAKLCPEDHELEKFMKNAATIPPIRHEALDDEEDEYGEEYLTVAEMIRAVEARGSLVHTLDEFPASPHLVSGGASHRARVDVEHLKESLSEIGRTSGVMNAVILDRDGEVIADVTHTESLTRKQFSDLVTEIITTAENASRRMDVGTFHWCTVETASGSITIGKVKNLAVGLKYEPSVKVERAQDLLQEFTARSLTMSMEVAGA